jgi:hypothetical protein
MTRITRDFDPEGRLVREVVEEDARIVFPVPPPPEVTWTACTCPVVPCAMHGWLTWQPARITCRLTSQANHSRSHEVAGLHLQ